MQSVHNNAILSPGDIADVSQFSPAEKDLKFPLLSTLDTWGARGRQPLHPPAWEHKTDSFLKYRGFLLLFADDYFYLMCSFYMN